MRIPIEHFPKESLRIAEMLRTCKLLRLLQQGCEVSAERCTSAVPDIASAAKTCKRTLQQSADQTHPGWNRANSRATCWINGP
ncbi:MAG: hypothetical protein OEZ08_09485, partial [Betaproteobacteria bacterium]|nr:hypothetical protein [Betaproteobacteria bacterium]